MSFTLIVTIRSIMVSVVMVNEIMLNVVAPFVSYTVSMSPKLYTGTLKRSSLQKEYVT
jgi:hypothetical protein